MTAAVLVWQAMHVFVSVWQARYGASVFSVNATLHGAMEDSQGYVDRLNTQNPDAPLTKCTPQADFQLARWCDAASVHAVYITKKSVGS